MNEGCGGQREAYQMLLDNIPGGVQQHLNDEAYTLVEVNQGFLELFGYTKQELQEQFENQYMQMIHPEDRQSVVKQVAEQLLLKKRVALEYRVFCRDGSYKWVLDNSQMISCAGEKERFFCVLVDITENRKVREELRLSLERHQIIMDQTTDVIFEWDIREDTLVFSSNWEKRFGYEPIRTQVKDRLLLNSHVHSDDIPVLRQLLTGAYRGIPFSSADLRIQKADGEYPWCRIRVTDQFDESGKPVKAVGVIADIDEQKKAIDELKQRAERDALTGLYNRMETELQVKTFLASEPAVSCALIMVDTDNFKHVNDTNGHLYGDAVLSEIASGMKKLLRQSDVVGRIGGDEFILFLKGIPPFAVEKKAEELLQMFRQLFRQDKQALEITCSVGIARYPEDGTDYQTLYRCADQALYRAKSRGKDRYVLYDRENAVSVENTGYVSAGTSIDSNQSAVPSDLIGYVFQILFDSRDLEHALGLILEIIGKRFDVSRAYIFESTPDGRYCDNTYEWCNSGIEPEKDRLQHLSYAELDHFEKLYGDSSVFYCRDIHTLSPKQAAFLEAQGIRSTLQCAIREGERLHGFVGFDECTGKRLWTKEEVETLSLVARMLAVFLQKRRASDRDRQAAQQMKALLDAQEAYLYVVDMQSRELLYLNRKAREMDPLVRTGNTCHQAFFGSETPCAHCPLCKQEPAECYIPQYHMWMKVHTGILCWDEREAYLLSCYDITEYKGQQEEKQ